MLGLPKGLFAVARRLVNRFGLRAQLEALLPRRDWRRLSNQLLGQRGRPKVNCGVVDSLVKPVAPPISFRCLEPRRVLSVNAVFAAGVLDIAITNDGGNVNASLLSDDGTDFFVDANSNGTFDDGTVNPLELRGLLADLTRINVLGDAGVGTFFWGDNFSAAALSPPGGNVLSIAQVFSTELAATANVTGNVSVDAEQSIQLGGALSITGDLIASTNLPAGSITTSATGSLVVSGHADLTSANITLGTAGGDHLALGSLTVNSTGSVDIAEDGSLADPNTLLVGSSTAASANIVSNGSITLASGASISTDAGLDLTANLALQDITIDGLISSTSGNITLQAGDQITLGNAASIETGGAGQISLTADGSGMTLTDGSQLGAASGDIRLTALDNAGGDIALSLLSSSGGAVQVLAAGDITDGTAGESANILSPTGSLLLRSLGGSIGTAAEDLDIDVQNLIFEAGTTALGVVHVSDLAGGLRINGASQAAAGATLRALSPLTIAADISVGASSTFTAGDSAAAGDNLTIENAAVVTLTSLSAATLTFNAGDDIVLRDGGRIVTTGSISHEVNLNADLDHLGLGAVDGDRGSITQDGTPIIEVTTNRLTARAAEGIDLDTRIDELDAASSLAGNILIDEFDSIRLISVTTSNGAINVSAAGAVEAMNVDSTGTDSDSNDITITTSSGNVTATLVRAGIFSGDVLIDAQGSILDGDTGIDGVDVQGNNVTLISQTGNIGVEGSFFKDLPNALEVVTNADPLDPILSPGNLNAMALLGSIALNASVAGTTTLAANTLFVISTGDLDVSTSTFAFNSLALIADSDKNGTGTLTLGDSLTVAGDLRLEGANIVSVGVSAPQLNLSASRLLFRSGAQAQIEADVNVLDASTSGNLSIRATRAAIELVDLNCDNVALQTTDAAGSIVLESFGTITVADDVLAGNDGTTTSTGQIQFLFAVGATGDLLIHDTILADQGDILLAAPGSIRIEPPLVADPFDEDGADNLPVISTIDGNIRLTADTDNDGGALFMANGARIITGRAPVDYLPGVDGLASPSTIALGVDAKGVGLATITLTATDAITLGSLQSANSTSSAVLVNSSTGAIVDGGDTDVDIWANHVGAQVTLLASGGIGSANALETALNQLDARNVGLAGNVGIHEVAAGGSLVSVAALNSANGGSVMIGVDAGSLNLVGGGVTAINGNITLLASNDIHVQSAVNTTGAGDVYMLAGNDTIDALLPQVDGLTIDVSVTAESGSILLQSQRDIRATAQISSTNGDIGLTALNDITLTNVVSSTNANVMIDAGLNLLMESTASVAGDDVLLSAGGSVLLAQVMATRAAIDAGNDITDNNATLVNVTANSLNLVAGGTIGQADAANGLPDENDNAIEIEVGTVAASSTTGVYLHQLAGGGSLTAGNLAGLIVNVEADQVALDGSTLLTNAMQTVAGQQGLSATGGPVKVRVDDGDLIIALGGGVSIGGDGLLWASADVIVNDSVNSLAGHVTLRAGDDVLVNASISTAGSGSLFVLAGNAVNGDIAGPNVDGISINGSLSTDAGGILLSSARDILMTATASSTAASVGMSAAGAISQSANITAASDVLVDAGGDFTMSAGSSLVAVVGDVLVRSAGTIALSTVEGASVALVAGLNIANVNGLIAPNVVSTSLSLLAGGAIGDSDALNGTPDLNARAINVATSTLAAQATEHIYIQQLAAGGDLNIDNVAALNVQIDVSEVRFNSTTTPAFAQNNANTLDDLTTNTGPIKLVVRDGSLTINDGALSNGLGVLASGAGDVLLAASADVNVLARIDGGSGHVTLQAGDNLLVGAAVSTTGAGTLYLTSGAAVPGGEIVVSATVTADNSILLSAQGDITILADITSNAASLGLQATGNIQQVSNLSAASGDILLAAGGTYSQVGDIVAGGSVQLASGGTVALNFITASDVSIASVSGDILDANGLDVSNVRANSLSISAGGMIGGPDPLAVADQNANAIDIEVNTVAAFGGNGIYLQQLNTAGSLVVDLAGVASTVPVNQVRFNSTLTPVTASSPVGSAPMADLVTADGPIKVAVRNGSLTINDGDIDGVGVSAGGAGDILLQSTADLTINASVSSGSGHISLLGVTAIDLNAAVSTGGAGSIYVAGQTIDVDATVDSANGDILVLADDTIRTTGAITSTAGSIGLVTNSGSIIQLANIIAGGDVLLDATGDITQAAVVTSAGGDLQASSATGTLRIGDLSGNHVSLTADVDILDANGQDIRNIGATSLALVAGGFIGGADLLNSADANGNAIDIEVGTIAALSVQGIYLQQLAGGGSLVVAQATGAASVAVATNQVRFNSSLTSVSASNPTVGGPLADLEATNGPIKVTVRGGSLTVNDGDGDSLGVLAGGANDVLLQSTANLTVSASVSSGTGHISLLASAATDLNAAVFTAATGSILITGQTIDVDATINAEAGDILLIADDTIRTTATIVSTMANLGLVAVTGDVLQSASAIAGGDFLVDAGGDYTQSVTTSSASGAVQVVAGGTIRLGAISGTHVSLTAGLDILDNSLVETANIQSQTVGMSAGGIIGGSDIFNASDANLNAIDLEVLTVAARSGSGIYLQQLASSGNLTIDQVPGGASASATVNQVRFNSSLTPVSASNPLAGGPLADLETSDGPIKVTVRGGSLTVNDGDGDGLGVSAGGTGDILLQCTADLIINASVFSGTGHISLLGTNTTDLNATVLTAGAGSVYVVGQTIDVDASINATDGDVLLLANDTIRTTATITSSAGGVGLIASTGDVLQGANVSAGNDFLVEAGVNYTQTNSVSSALGTAQVIVGGTIRLVAISGDHVSLSAGQDILDISVGETANIQSQTLAMVAGGIIGGPDVLNASDANANAIDIEVGTLAARSGRGIYLQELAGGGDLIVDDVSGSASVTVNQVRFNSTTSLVAAGDPLGVDLRPLEDLETGDGPIKLVVRNGSLTINDGLPADGVGVSAGGVQDVLLWASGNLTTNAGVTSGGGHVTLQAGGNLTTNANLSTLLSGDVYLLSGNDLAVNAPVSNVSGSMLLSAGNNLATTGALSSTAGSVGLVAVGSIAQSANITAGGDVLFEAGGNITQTAVVTSAGGNLQATSTTGTLSIGELSADHVSLTAGVDILDVNGENVRNIRAASLAMVAGGIIGGPDVLNAADANANAIDIEVGTLAARSGRGIYLQELAGGGDLIVDDVSGSASVTVNQVRFNSTTSLVAAGDPLGVDLRPLEDLETGDGPIKLVVRNGSLTINDGLPADGVGVSAGGVQDVLLWASGNLTTNAGVTSGGGHVTLQAGGNLTTNANLSTLLSGDVYLLSGNDLAVNAPQ